MFRPSESRSCVDRRAAPMWWIAGGLGVLLALGCAGLTDADPPPEESAPSSPTAPMASDPAQLRQAALFPVIMRALADNAITEGQAQQYLWAALLRTPGQIPAALGTTEPDASSARQATASAHMLMQRVEEDWSRYSTAEQEGIAQSMERAGIPLFNLVRPGGASNERWYSTDGLFFCRYAQLGSPGQHLDLYDEISASLPQCAGQPGTSCSDIRTAGGQVACSAAVNNSHCIPRRYYESCEAGWLDPAYADQRDELLEHAPRPHQVLLDKLGLQSRSRSTPLAQLILLHTSGGNDLAVTIGAHASNTQVFFAADTEPSAACSGAPTLRLGRSVSHELFHVAQRNSVRWGTAANDEATATWFESDLHPTWDTEHEHFSAYHCAPEVAINQRAYHGGRALSVLLAGQGDVLFGWMREGAGEDASRLDLQQQLAGLPLAQREALHTLSEQSYGLTINTPRNDVCVYPSSDHWRNGTCMPANDPPERPRTSITAAGSPVQIDYEVLGLSWTGHVLDVAPEVQELRLQVDQSDETRTSLMVGGPPERVIPLERGENRFCLRDPRVQTGCLCQGIPSDRYISREELALVSTQLDSTDQTVRIVASAQQGALPKPGCWQVVSGRGEVGGHALYTLEHGPVVRIMPRPDGVPEDWPACTVILVEDHTRTAYTHRPPVGVGAEQHCTVQARTAFPAEMLPTERGAAQESGTLSAFTRLRPYLEGQQHTCTGGDLGITDQGSPIIGPLGMLIVGTDRGRVPTRYQYTAQSGGDRMTLIHDTVSNDGVSTYFEAELVAVSDQQCTFAAGVLQRALTRLQSR